ncbi:MAG: UDP-N-acetylmuramate-L-alanine ligase [Parcubacteria group bacterium GW2011_GWF2_38_76]|nr:MAG: UDP-N-acetylmuramate-L-alanine ligase [Parcubacteria group bacterium GW2011_GWF2_38_76]HBM45839.1 UDP-N-acetylmuramate--L-alanine ligase [Patescibacteria group bacterium]
MELNLSKIKKVHFIGIGGIGVSAIARLMLIQGKEVTGSDRSSSPVTAILQKLGAKITFGHNEGCLEEDTDVVIYTIAIDEKNPEFVKAKRLEIKMLSYPEMLGVLSREKYTIAVSGTHGKTTTTAMIGKILLDTDKDPTIIVGSLMKGPMSNLVVGESNLFVVEACEYRRSFLNLSPKMVVITNIDNDHLDYYRDMDDIKSAFAELVSKLGPKDYLVCNKQDDRLWGIIKNAKCIIVDYSQNKLAEKLNLKVVGNHNIENAKAALSVAEILEIDPEGAGKALEGFAGTWRRFEYKGETKGGAMIYDDYAHHPTEIRATLQGARQFFKDKKIFVAFQPHLYSRTKLLLDDFAKSFDEVDVVLVPDIYAAREPVDHSISSEDLVREILKNNPGKTVLYLKQLEDIENYLREEAGEGSVIITMGAGNISGVSDNLVFNK